MKTKKYWLALLLLFWLCGAAGVPFLQDYERNPDFPGGHRELIKYLNANLIYPKDAMEQGIEGRVILRFQITSSGKVDSITVVKSLFSSCDEEAVRLVTTLPRWIPGLSNFRVAAYWCTLPVLFTLNEEIDFQAEIAATEFKPVMINPQFPGGEEALQQYIQEHLYFPPSAAASVREGQVFLQFVVTSNGELENIKVLQSLDPEYDQIALEIVKNMPRWKPADENGKPIDFYYFLPVTFKVEN
jgi:TonB family protein